MDRGKAYAIPADRILSLIPEGLGGCYATDDITVHGHRVGWMYREAPGEMSGDTGWRFFSGRETQTFCDDPANWGFYNLNTVCNYDPEVTAFLDLPIGTTVARTEDGPLRICDAPNHGHEF